MECVSSSSSLMLIITGWELSLSRPAPRLLCLTSLPWGTVLVRLFIFLHTCSVLGFLFVFGCVSDVGQTTYHMYSVCTFVVQMQHHLSSPPYLFIYCLYKASNETNVQ